MNCKLIALLMAFLIVSLPLAISDNITAASGASGTGIDVVIPEYLNSQYIDIQGKTSTFSQIKLYVNNNLARQLSDRETGQEGKISFLRVELRPGSNRIKIWSQSQEGAITEKEFTTIVDTQQPKLEITSFPDIIANKSAEIKGRVDEKAKINVYITRTAEDEAPPARVTGLQKTDVGSNLIEFSWNEAADEDFSKYLIYRKDVGLIATASPASYNSYSDALVGSGQSYTYHVSAIDINGNEGQFSEELAIITLPGGNVNATRKPERINITKAEGKKGTFIETMGAFSIPLSVDKDGEYTIKIEAVDSANNKASVERYVVVDTVAPTFREIDPKPGAQIFENSANEVDISGYTEPNIEVSLLYNKTSLKTTEKTTFSDSGGYFIFKEVNIRPSFVGGITPHRVSETEIDDYYNKVKEYDESDTYHSAELELRAVDKVGHVAYQKLNYELITCWSGNWTWNVRAMPQYQSPTWLSTERISEGSEAIYFYLNFTYNGIGTEPVINSVSISKACDDYNIKDPKIKLGCELLPSKCNYKASEDKKTLYVSCPLKKMEEWNYWLENDWKDFFDSINDEAIFPFKLRINYAHTLGQDTSTEYQTMCTRVTYVVDSTKINFKDVLPDWLLYDAVNFLNSTISDINDVQEELENVIEWVGIGCIASFALKAIITIYRRFKCYWEGYVETTKKQIEKLALAKEKGEDKTAAKEETSSGEPSCPAKEDEQNLLSNADLTRACKSCSDAWKNEEKLYTLYRSLCDRVFCHTAPAGWTADRSDTELQKKFEKEQSVCAENDDAIKGSWLTDVKCNSRDKNDLNWEVINANNAGNSCYWVTLPLGTPKKRMIYVRTADSTFGDIYKFTVVSTESSSISFEDDVYAKATGTIKKRYQTATPYSCQEICSQRNAEAYGCGISKNCIDVNLDPSVSDEARTKMTTAFSELQAKSLKGSGPLSVGAKDKDGNYILYSGAGEGMTMDCMFGNRGNGNSVMHVTPTTEEPFECCCIKKAGEGSAGEYYNINDYGMKPSEQNKEYPEWSYRYQHIKFKTGPWSAPDKAPAQQDRLKLTTHVKYNPNRYVKGRDWPGCFGQQTVFLSGEEAIMHDPSKSWVSTFQCACLSGIYNRLQQIKVIMTAMRNCLVTVRETGTSDTGACKELFSQYVCSLIWRTIMQFRDGCFPWGRGIELEAQLGDAGAAVKGGIDAVWGGIAESQTELAEEYGNAELNNLFGAGEDAVARKICLAAFGYDWDLSVEDILDTAYATPVSSLVQKITGTREYLTFDPASGQSQYEYRASWIIAPGCEMDDYDVELACVTREQLDNSPGVDCDVQQDPVGSNCDCLNQKNEQTRMLFDGRTLSSGALEDQNAHEVMVSPYRYDHLKITLRTGRDVSDKLKSSCFPEDHENGVFYFPITDKTAYDVAACQVNAQTGTFGCPQGEIFWGGKGQGYIDSLLVNSQEPKEVEIYEGEEITINPTIWKAEGADLCLQVDFQDSYGYSILKNKGLDFENGYITAINMPGKQEYGPIPLLENANLVATPEVVLPAEGNHGGILTGKTSGEQSFREGAALTLEFKDIWSRDGSMQSDDEITVGPESKDFLRVVDIGQEKPIGDWIKGIENNKANLLIVSSDRGINIEINGVTLGTLPESLRRKGQGDREESETFIVKTRARGSATIGNTGIRKIKLKLFHLKGNNQSFTNADECNLADPVSYNGKKQEKVYEITLRKGGGRKGICIGEGITIESYACDCDKDGTSDCGGAEFRTAINIPGYEYNKYCYAPAGSEAKRCRPWPLCNPKAKATVPCDCDANGGIADAVLRQEVQDAGQAYLEDCDGKLFNDCREGKCHRKTEETK